MVRSLSTLLCTILSAFAFGQCVYCTSLDEAMVDPGKVKTLDLRAKGLMSFPDSLEIFTSLETLDLSHNFIQGLNDKNYALFSLKELNLSDNPSINLMDVDNIGDRFPNLEMLDLHDCHIKYVSPQIASLGYLKEIDLSNNDIRFLPQEFGDLSRLVQLDISGNEFEDTFFLRELWKIRSVDLGGNEDIALREVGAALLHKDGLQELRIDPTNKNQKFPDEFEDLTMSKLILSGGELMKYNFKVCNNDSLRYLIVDDCEIDNTALFIKWVNRFGNLESLELRNMIIKPGLEEVKVKTLIFKDCELENKSELKKIDPKVNIVSYNTDISDGKYVGNSLVATLQASRDESIPLSIIPIAEDMQRNEVTPIVKPQPVSFKINSVGRNWIEMKESSYAIPENAFLNKDGSVYTGEVELKITEFTDPIINALAGVPMIFNTDERNEIFASNGMLEFRAYDSNGNELQANPSRMIQVRLKDVQPGENSNLYVYNEDSNNWTEVGKPDPTDYDSLYNAIIDSLNALPDENFLYTKVVQRPIFFDYKKSRRDPYMLDFSTISINSRKPDLGNGINTIYTNDPDQRWLCKKTDWMIDTLITEETDQFLKEMKKNLKKSQKYWRKKQGGNYYYAPRLIKELKIEPNFENDNYTMSFRYLDSTVTYPVYPTYNGSIRRVQDKERNAYKDYEKNVKMANKETDRIQGANSRAMKIMANTEREKRARTQVELQKYRDGVVTNPYLLGAASTSANDLEEYNSFGLQSFGLVNCDYFSRNIPDNYIAFDSVGVDSRGDFVKMPPTIRNIYLDDNSFVTTRSDLTPVYKNRRSIAMIVLSSVEIAIIRGWEQLTNGTNRADVERINIEGLRPDEVRQKILGVE